MMVSIIGFVLALIGLMALALQRFYSSVPAKELRRLAARGDHLAVALYRAVAYGASLRFLLWMVVSSGLTAGIVLFTQSLPAWLAAAAILLLLLVGFVVLQSGQLTVRTARLTAALSPAIATLLAWVEPVIGRATHRMHKRRTFVPHSGLYEKEDLVDLLDQQKQQSDNRISHDEIELARRALHFNETQAADVMTTRAAMKTLKGDDVVGPILLEELHKSGQTSFVVYDGETAVGIAQLQAALKLKEGGKIASIMDKDLVFVHEDFSLRQVMDACLKTGRSLVIVINAFEEMVGVISLETLVHELFGEAAETNLAYQNRATVAAYKSVEKADESVAEEAVTPADEQSEKLADSSKGNQDNEAAAA